jgi:competence protein ComFC
MIRQILNTFFPQKCFSCGKIIYSTPGMETRFNLLCRSCANELKPISSLEDTKCRKCCSYLYQSNIDICYNCSQTDFSFRRNTSLYYYKDPVIRHLMHKFKFNSNRLAGEDISRLLKKGIQDYLKNNSYDNLIIAPLSRISLRKRGFNQVEFILKKCQIKFIDILIRKKHSKHQSELTAEERRDWIRGQFQIREEYWDRIAGKSLLVIDDLFTTGSTANEIGCILIEHGAVSVDILTFFKD